MRILHVTDTHLGAHLHVRGAPRDWRRGDDHLACLRAALQPALDEQVDLVLHTGDVFDRSSPPPDAVDAAAELWRQVARRVPVVLMPGNHDRKGLSRTTPVHHPGIHVVDHGERLVVADVALAVVPFLADADGWAQVAKRAVGPGVDLLLAHQAVDGCRVPGYTFRVGRHRDCIGPEHLPAGITHVLCGHIHPRQVLPCGDAVVVMPGSTERTSASEEHQTKGACLWTLDREIRWDFVDTPARPWVEVRGPTDLARIAPGSLVSIPRKQRTPDLDAAARAAGGWVLGPPPQVRTRRHRRPPDPQATLF
ncbi:MAG: exonuclease SbcCD subunit D [Alphaproteobacteria bacterium]|nr:exonuclease SbcCD subunit D [Alphaproteobacteria bacterium]